MSQPPVASQPIDTFVQMSVLLTGFAESVLAPSLDPIDLKTTLFDTAQKNAGEVFDRLLAQFEKLSGGKPVSELTPAERESIGNALLGLDGQEQDPQVSATARSVMLSWYLGSWYQPFTTATAQEGAQTVISDQAYIGGLSWRAMQSHAMGNSNFTFGYWAESPPPLEAFTGNPTSEGGS